MSAQSQVGVALQRGVSVQMAVTSNGVPVPNADKPDAAVVALTAEGSVYLRANRISISALSDSVRSILATSDDKTVYIKADARVPYARLVEVMDAVRTSGAEGLTFLTMQHDSTDRGSRPVSPKGLEMRVKP